MIYSNDLIWSVNNMAERFGFFAKEPTREVIDYRIGLLKEEFDETMEAVEEGDAEGIVDGHIDLIVVALGNLSIMGVDTAKAFNQVMNANMSKEVGKRDPSDPEGMSICKPEGWVGPDHSDNHGVLDGNL